MARIICPQVAGIYESNMDNEEFKYLLLPKTRPNSGYWATDAFPCTLSGEKLERWENGGIVATASDFGDCVGILSFAELEL